MISSTARYWPHFLVAALLLVFCPATWALRGDIDGSGRVDGVDLSFLSRALGKVRGQRGFLDRGDLDGDGRITDRDIAIVRANFARKGRDENLWVADAGRDRLVKINVRTGRVLRTVAVPGPAHVAVNTANGDVWAAALGGPSTKEALRIDTRGRVVSRVAGFEAIADLAVDPVTGACYVADNDLDRVFRIDPAVGSGADVTDLASAPVTGLTSYVLTRDASSLAVDGGRGALWVLVPGRELIRVSVDAPPGYNLLFGSGFHLANDSIDTSLLGRLGLNPVDGSIYVTDQTVSIFQGTRTVQRRHRVVRVPAGNVGELLGGGLGIGNFLQPGAVAVNPLDGSAWVADDRTPETTLVKVAGDGREIVRQGGFQGPLALSLDPLTGVLWVADRGRSRVVALSPAGLPLLSLTDFASPVDLAVLPGDSVLGAPRASGLVSPAVATLGQPISFDGVASSPGSTVVRFEWDFDGDGNVDFSSATTGRTTHTYPREGVFQPTFRVRDADSLTAVDYTPLVRVGTLRAVASATPQRGEAPLSIDLLARGSNPLTGRIESVQWDFDGDGIFDSFQDADTTTVAVHHTYPEAGNFRAVLKVSDEDGRTAQDSLLVTVLPAQPNVRPTAIPSQGEAPLDVQLDASASVADGSIALYAWDFDGDGQTDYASVESPRTRNVFSRAGVIEPRLTVTDTKGLTASAVVTVTVGGSDVTSPRRPIVLPRGSPLRGAAPLTVQFGADAADPDGSLASFAWIFGDGDTDDTVFFQDDGENGLANFPSVEGNWATTAGRAASGSSFTESPQGNYQNREDARLTSRKIQVAGAAEGITLSYAQAYDTESCCDFGRVELSLDGGAFSEIPGSSVSGAQTGFQRVEHALPDLTGVSTVRIRFRFTSDGSVTRDGWYIDDIRLAGRILSADSTSPTTASTSHVYTNAGDFVAELTVTDDGGNSSTGRLPIRVLPSGTPTAVAAVSPLEGAAPLEVTLDGSGSSDPDGSLTKFEWSPYSAVFADDMESDAGKWVSTGTWQISSELTLSGQGAWNDSPNTDASTDTAAVLLSEAFDMPDEGAVLSFWHRYDIPDSGDRGEVFIISETSGEERTLGSFSGDVTRFVPYDPRPFHRSSFQSFQGDRVRLRFTLFADGDTTIGDGWVIDDVAVKGVGPILFDVDAGGSSTTPFTYRIPGEHRATLRVTDSSGNTALSTAIVRVSAPREQNETPSVSLFVSPSSGNAPLAVNVSTSGFDRDGSLVEHALDVDGDGLFDRVSSSRIDQDFLFSTPGRFTARARVTDDRGATRETTRAITVNGSLPRITASVEPVRGVVPQELTFRIDASSPSGSPATHVEVALNGFSFETVGTSVPLTVVRTVTSSLNRTPQVRVTNAEGGRAQAATEAVLIQNVGQVLAVASASPSSGPAPLEVQFSGAATNLAGGDSVALYRWDFTNDGIFDFESSATGNVSHIYPGPGDFTARFEVRTASNRTSRHDLRVRVGRPPISRPRASPLTGTAPLLVTFFSDGEDPDGTIESYDWDFEGAGVFPGVRGTNFSQISRNFQHTYDRPGVYQARQRVTDQEGFSDTRSVTITVLPGGDDGDGTATLLAEPSSGLAPLTVRLSAGLGSGSRRAARYRFDRDGDGSVDLDTSTTHQTGITFEAPGLYRPSVRIEDDQGDTQTGRTFVTVRALGAPAGSVTYTPQSGKAPLSVDFNAQASDPDGGGPLVYQWDFDGDGTIDQAGTENRVLHLFKRAGRFDGRLAIIDDKGDRDVLPIPVAVQAGLSGSRQPATFDPDSGETMTIRTALTAAARITLRLQDREGRTVRTLVKGVQRSAGAYEDVWDGKDDGGQPVDSGVYFFVVDFDTGQEKGTFDPTGDVKLDRLQITPDYDRTFNPLANKFLTVRFTLDRLAEATLYVVEFPGSAVRRVKTLLLREPLPAGSYVIPWDGTDDSGNPARTDVDYIMPVFFFELPINAVVVAGRPILGDPSANPSIFSPAANPYAADATDGMDVSYTVSKRSRVDAVVLNSSNVALRTFRFEGQAPGRHSFTWDGRDADGLLADKGTYRIRLTATDARGSRSPVLFVSTRITY